MCNWSINLALMLKVKHKPTKIKCFKGLLIILTKICIRDIWTLENVVQENPERNTDESYTTFKSKKKINTYDHRLIVLADQII